MRGSPARKPFFSRRHAQLGRGHGRVQGQTPAGATLEERLASVGTNILKALLISNVIDFMRLSIAEAGRFPNLANVGRMARERGAQAVTQVLSEVTHSDEIGTYPAFAAKRLATTTRFFLDLVVTPLLMRAIFGEELKKVRAEIELKWHAACLSFLVLAVKARPSDRRHRRIWLRPKVPASAQTKSTPSVRAHRRFRWPVQPL